MCKKKRKENLGANKEHVFPKAKYTSPNHLPFHLRTIGGLTKGNPYSWHAGCKAVKVHYSLCYCHLRSIFKTVKLTESCQEYQLW